MVQGKSLTGSDKNNHSLSGRSFFLYYTLAFLLLSFGCFLWVLLQGRSLVWKQDGLEQHYLAFLYLKRYLTEVLRTVFTEHSLNIPLWDMSIGYGADILTTMHYYGLGDPFTFFSLLVPEGKLDILFGFLLFLKLYLAGAGFCLFARHHRAEELPAIAGACVYCFTTWTLYYCLHQFCFIIPILYFPYVLLGIDRVIEKDGKPFLFIISLALVGLSNFYFTYMVVVLGIFYAVFRYIGCSRGNNIKDALKLVGRFILYGAVAMLIAAVFLYPSVMTMATSSRYSAGRNFTFFYPLQFYLDYLSAFCGTASIGEWSGFGYTPHTFLACILLFLRRNEFKRLKQAFIVLTLFTLIPMAGCALNGFAYPTNRWAWCYNLLAANIVAVTLPWFKSLTERELKILFAASVLYGVLVLLSPDISPVSNLLLLLLMLSECVLLLCLNKRQAAGKYSFIAVSGCIAAGLFFNACSRLSPFAIKYRNLSGYLKYGEANERLSSRNADELMDKDRPEPFRIEELGVDFVRNSSDIRRTLGTNYYLSMTEAFVPEFIIETALNAERTYMYRNLDGRGILQALLSVKYLFVNAEDADTVPAALYKDTGRSKTVKDSEVRLFEANNPLPFGYCYDKWISYGTFGSLEPEERQLAMLKYAVLEDGKAGDLPEYTYPSSENRSESGIHSILKEIVENDSVRVEGSEIYVLKDGASAELKTELPVNDGGKEYEMYAVYKGVDFKPYSEREKYLPSEWDAFSLKGKLKVILTDILDLGQKDTDARFGVIRGERYRTVEFMTRDNIYYCGQDNFLSCLGSIRNPGDGEEMYLNFQKAGVYSFDRFDIVLQDTSVIAEGISERAESCLKNVSFGKNSIEGSISLERPQILMISVPYSEGWEAFVDGRREEIRRANVMMMALPLTEGQHKVELRYHNPNLRTGSIMSLIGIAALIFLLVFFSGIRLRSRFPAVFQCLITLLLSLALLYFSTATRLPFWSYGFAAMNRELMSGDGKEAAEWLENSYNNGFRVFELCFPSGSESSVSERWKELSLFLSKKPDAYFIIGCEASENEEAGDPGSVGAVYREIRDQQKAAGREGDIKRIIPQVYSSEEYDIVTKIYDWSSIIPSWDHIKEKDLNPGALIKEAKREGAAVVSLPFGYENRLIDTVLLRQGILPFVRYTDQENEMKERASRGVKGFFTGLSSPPSDIFGQEKGPAETSAVPEKPEYSFDYSWTDNEYIAHALGAIEGKSYTNSREALEKNYALGVRVFEADLRYTSDRELVLIHKWSTFPADEDDPPSHEEFMKSRISGKFTPMDLKELILFMKDHPDMYLVIDGKAGSDGDMKYVAGEYGDILRTCIETSPEIVDRIIPQIYNREMLKTLMGIYDWKSMIYTLYHIDNRDFDPYDEADFCLRSGVGVITMNEKRENDLLNGYLSDRGITLYVHTINDPDTADELRKRNIHGFYTDSLFEK